MSPAPWLVNWSQVLGAGLSLLALVVALFALIKAKYDLAKERRRQHELELLRSIAELLELQRWESGDERLQIKAKIGSRLLLLPQGDMPTVRAAISAGSTPEQDAALGLRVEHFLQSPAGRDQLEAAQRETPGADRETLVASISNYDAIRWDFVTRHVYEEGGSAYGYTGNHVYGYTDNSIALQELRAAIDGRL
jgi:hypothetical protein